MEKLGKTYITRVYPWGLNARNGHRLLCGDGKIRAAELAETADSFFSTPASVRVKGKRITGYMTCEESENGNRVYSFRSHDCHYGVIPKWPKQFTDEYNSLVDKNQ